MPAGTPRRIGRTAAGAPSLSQRPFRPDIEGLRAVAVMLVIAFHAGLQDVSGGYVDVDVISGFPGTHLLDPSRNLRPI
jgi:peptidoglycan/LPS O-acetylase OafA/YrhL